MPGTQCYHSRTFVRHPSEVAIRIHSEGVPRHASRRMQNISEGGLSCRSEEPLQVGCRVSVTIPIVSPPFVAAGEVVWCRHSHACFELGIQFLEEESAYAARMVEQLCYIERYRHEIMLREGRMLDSDAAAVEWIEKYAADFPRL